MGHLQLRQREGKFLEPPNSSSSSARFRLPFMGFLYLFTPPDSGLRKIAMATRDRYCDCVHQPALALHCSWNAQYEDDMIGIFLQP
jgi:hypothetical protein